MDTSTLLLLFFTLLSTLLVGSNAEYVLDWAGEPVEAGVPYEMWIVGYHNGPIAAGSFTDQVKGHQYAIDKAWYCNRTFYGDLARIQSNSNDAHVSVDTDYYISFNTTSWIVSGDFTRGLHNFIIGVKGDFSLFQFKRVDGTIHNPYLYKLLVNEKEPTDVILVTNKAGERSLYYNQDNLIPDPWGIKISFVKGRLGNEFDASSM